MPNYRLKTKWHWAEARPPGGSNQPITALVSPDAAPFHFIFRGDYGNVPL